MTFSTDIDIAVLHDAIVSDIKKQFPNLATVEFYREDRKDLPKPACLLEMGEFETDPDNDPGTEQLCVIASFEARLIIGFREIDGMKAKLSIRVLAAAMAAWLRDRRWTNPANPEKKLPTGQAMVIGAYPDDFEIMGRRSNEGLDQFEIWRIEWKQRINIGNTIWTDEGITPNKVLSGISPDIGTGHEDDYTQVTP